MTGLTDKAKDLILFLFLIGVWVTLEVGTILFVNIWILANAWFGFTLFGLDLRTILIAWVLGIFYAWLLWQYWDWRDFKKWRRENKHWLRD